MCKHNSFAEFRRQIAEKISSLTGEYTVDEIIKIVYDECNVCEEEKDAALSVIDDVLENATHVPFTDKYLFG